MSVKPILFNGMMVRAILDGRKTVTRRAIKPQPGEKLAYIWGGSNHGKWSFSPYNESRYEEHRAANDWKYWTPPCHTDDVLWVRETWNRGYIDSSDAELCNESWFEEYHKRDGSFLDGISGYVYRADFTRAEEYELGTLDEDNAPRPMPWRPSIHMPREAARIFLRVTNVRVERLQEIDKKGAIAEGCSLCYPQGHFKSVWQHTIKPVDRERYGWGANPWVWVIEFERCEMPEED